MQTFTLADLEKEWQEMQFFKKHGKHQEVEKEKDLQEELRQEILDEIIQQELAAGKLTPEALEFAQERFGAKEMAVKGLRELAQDKLLEATLELAVDTATSGGVASGVKLVYQMIEGNHKKREQDQDNSLVMEVPGLRM